MNFISIKNMKRKFANFSIFKYRNPPHPSTYGNPQHLQDLLSSSAWVPKPGYLSPGTEIAQLSVQQLGCQDLLSSSAWVPEPGYLSPS